MRILVTGGAGFIGSNLILYWLKRCPHDFLINVDKLTYAADLDNLKEAEGNPNYKFIKADIAIREQVKNVVQKYKPEGVIHLAAESHVDNSIKGPEAFILSNVLGTFNVLEECRLLWSEDRSQLEANRFHHVSTDEVFGALGAEGNFKENSPYLPNSPYSATKAASDHLVRAHHKTYGMNNVITNCSNNFGPCQHEEKLIPTVISKALAGQPIPVYGQGLNVRDWLFVEDHCQAIDLVFHNGKNGETYNIGGKNEWKNIDLVSKICDVLNNLLGDGPGGDYKNLITFVNDRPGHDFRYAIDCSKIESELGWHPSHNFEENLKKTVSWYLKARNKV